MDSIQEAAYVMRHYPVWFIFSVLMLPAAYTAGFVWGRYFSPRKKCHHADLD